MQAELIELAVKYPQSFLVIGTACAAVIFNTGMNWANFKYMKANMVSKKDLKIELSMLMDKSRDEFITRKECMVIIDRRKERR